MVEEAPQIREPAPPHEVRFSPIFNFFNHPKIGLPKKISSVYPAQKIVKPPHPEPSDVIEKSKIPEKYFTEKHFTAAEWKTFLQLQSLGAHIEPKKISLGTLKKEYRRLAKIYHPDSAQRGIYPKKFHELVFTFHTLEKKLVFLSKP